MNEWGDATWDNDDFSIRNHFNTSSGKFNHAGSSELPWYDFLLMITESIKRDKFSNAEIGQVLAEISNEIAKIS